MVVEGMLGDADEDRSDRDSELGNDIQEIADIAEEEQHTMAEDTVGGIVIDAQAVVEGLTDGALHQEAQWVPRLSYIEPTAGWVYTVEDGILNTVMIQRLGEVLTEDGDRWQLIQADVEPGQPILITQLISHELRAM